MATGELCKPAGLTSGADVCVCHRKSGPAPWERLLQAEDGVGWGSGPFPFWGWGRNFLCDWLLLEHVLLSSWRLVIGLGPCDEGPWLLSFLSWALGWGWGARKLTTPFLGPSFYNRKKLEYQPGRDFDSISALLLFYRDGIWGSERINLRNWTWNQASSL